VESLDEDCPFAMAFVDIRMPPGWDGIETIEHLWEADPRLQVVICTAHSDYSSHDIVCKSPRWPQVSAAVYPVEATSKSVELSRGRVSAAEFGGAWVNTLLNNACWDDLPSMLPASVVLRAASTSPLMTFAAGAYQRRSSDYPSG
jgi:hypothetical protein